MQLTTMNQPQRPWLSLYRGVRPELTPDSETALDMFRATLERNRGAPLVHYFDRSLTAAECDAMSDALAVGLQAARRRSRRPRRGLSAEHSAGRASPCSRSGNAAPSSCRAIRCCASASSCKILRSSGCLALICQEDLYADVGRAALPATAVRHTITTSPLEFLDLAQADAGDAGRRAGAIAARASDMLEIVARARRRAAARRRAHGRRRRVHGAHVGHDGRRRRAR